MNVPKAMQDKYDEIAQLIKEFSDQHLNEEYLELCLKLLAKLCRKRPSPVLRGRITTWASSIIYAVGQVNFIFDSNQEIHLSAEELSEPFGVSKNTAANKAAELRKMFKMTHFCDEWTLPSKLLDRPNFTAFIIY